ncbi:MAG: hypothetical protein EA397_16985 [Deltaproteobacteria bacterium]|nr:MAG: hypothetical protein EA397_16985 [Deltaproteobacteria bacterium]
MATGNPKLQPGTTGIEAPPRGPSDHTPMGWSPERERSWESRDDVAAHRNGWSSLDDKLALVGVPDPMQSKEVEGLELELAALRRDLRELTEEQLAGNRRWLVLADRLSTMENRKDRAGTPGDGREIRRLQRLVERLEAEVRRLNRQVANQGFRHDELDAQLAEFVKMVVGG